MSGARGLAAAAVRATARLQLHRDFGFDAALEQLPYYARLGISHLYVSPILTARAGSMHGYDVVDHRAVNPELGGEEGLRRLVAGLREHGMGLIVDIVPNHMAVGGADNAWWLDVLAWGRDSAHASHFDIDWDVPDPLLRERVLAPFLGKPYGEALDDGELRLQFDPARGRFHVAYFDHVFPIAPTSHAALFDGDDRLAEAAARWREALGSRRGRSARHAAFDEASASIAAQHRDSAPMREAVDALLQRHDPATLEGRERLHQLMERQHYRLAWWRTAADEINWRRFFDVIDLAGLRIQEPAVFDAEHETVFRLYAEGLIDGLRVDHVDGLADPAAYCRKLRSRLRLLQAQRPPSAPPGPAYLVVEKILAPGEQLNRDWLTDGTSGYAFMNDVGAVLHDASGEEALTRLWRRCTGRSGDFEAEERAARRRIPQELLAADFNACAHALHVIAQGDPRTRDWTLGAIRRVLAELLVHFPVYRTYADASGRSEADAAIMRKVVAAAQQTCRPAERALVEQVDRWLGGIAPRRVESPRARRLALRAVARFQQLTSPVAAKSVEDTAFYRYGRLLSRNEVGANPVQFSMSVAEFHEACRERRRRYPMAMLATATHDHKRGEDLRARLAVISEMPEDWERAVTRWTGLNARLRVPFDGGLSPDATDEYLLYQMIVGAWPLQRSEQDADGLRELADRLAAWQQKAVREAKRRSGWVEPNLDYEAGCENFLRQLLDPSVSAEFLGELQRFVARLAPAGALNGLSQALLRCTSPGVPDLYQGTEFWDFSLVDPDNRRPVDYAARQRHLHDGSLCECLQGWQDGRIKQRLIARTLTLRQRRADLFARGDYLPLALSGARAAQAIAFARADGEEALLVIVPRLAASLLSPGSLAIAPASWLDTAVELPERLQRRWRDALGGLADFDSGPRLPLASVLRDLPLALLVGV